MTATMTADLPLERARQAALDPYRPPTPEARRERLLAEWEWCKREQAKQNAGQPSEWDQSFYYCEGDDIDNPGCGTTCCIAGHATIMHAPAGHAHADAALRIVQVRLDDAPTVREWEFAQAWLGLSARETTLLFEQTDTLTDVRDAIESILGEELP